VRWRRASTVLDDPKLTTWVGIRIGDPELRERFLSLDGGLRPVRDEHGFKRAKNWPVYRPIVVQGAWWADLDAYRQRILDVLGETLGRFGGHVRRLHEGS
jgi:hypothetical protein